MAGRARFVGAAVLLSLDQPIRAISLRRSPAPNQAVRAASLTAPIYSASGVVTGNPGAGFDMVGLQLNRVNVTCSCNAIARITGYPRCRVILTSCRELYMCHVTDQSTHLCIGEPILLARHSDWRLLHGPSMQPLKQVYPQPIA